MGLAIAISAGEASGDLHGSCLAARLRTLRDDLTLWGAGGERMRAAGVEIGVDMTGGGTIGISETVKTAPAILLRYFRMRSLLLGRHPDLFVPIDFGAFNIRLAQLAHKQGIPVVYYFPPSSWRRRVRNADRLLACGGKVITPFPWSAELLRQHGVDARFVGHPLLDVVKPARNKDEFIREVGLSGSLPIFGLLPGSRQHELNEHLEPMLDCATIVSRELGGAEFVVGAARKAEWMRARIREKSRRIPDFPTVQVVEGSTYDCMAHSDFLITASGTATLEAAILGTAMVIMYRGSWIMRFEFVFRRAVLEDHIGLPNIVADRGVCPELINEHVTPEKLADVTLSIYNDGDRMRRMKDDLARVREKLGTPGAVERAATVLLELGGLA